MTGTPSISSGTMFSTSAPRILTARPQRPTSVSRTQPTRDGMQPIAHGLNLAWRTVQSIADGLDLAWRTVNATRDGIQPMRDGLNLTRRTVQPIARGLNLIGRTVNASTARLTLLPSGDLQQQLGEHSQQRLLAATSAGVRAGL